MSEVTQEDIINSLLDEKYLWKGSQTYKDIQAMMEINNKLLREKEALAFQLVVAEQVRQDLVQQIQDLNKNLIFGFYEEKIPIYAQGPQQSELQELVTADEVNKIIAHLVKVKTERDEQIGISEPLFHEI